MPPDASQPDAALLAAERESNSLLIEFDTLWAKWPRGGNATKRAAFAGFFKAEIFVATHSESQFAISLVRRRTSRLLTLSLV